MFPLANNQSFCRPVRWPTGGTLTRAGRLTKCALPRAPQAHNSQVTQTPKERLIDASHYFTSTTTYPANVIHAGQLQHNFPNRPWWGPRFLLQEWFKTPPTLLSKLPQQFQTPEKYPDTIHRTPNLAYIRLDRSKGQQLWFCDMCVY